MKIHGRKLKCFGILKLRMHYYKKKNQGVEVMLQVNGIHITIKILNIKNKA